MKWGRRRSGNLLGEDYSVSEEADITVISEERKILAKCGLSVEAYIEAKTPSLTHVPASGIYMYCFNEGWYIAPNACTGEWRVVGKVSDFDWAG